MPSPTRVLFVSDADASKLIGRKARPPWDLVTM